MYTFLGWQCITTGLLILMVSMKRTRLILKGKHGDKLPILHIGLLKGVWYSTVLLPGILSITKNSRSWRMCLLGLGFIYWRYGIQNIEFLGGVANKWGYRSCIWRLLGSRGNVKCTWGSLDKTKQYIFVGHPHGVLPLYSVSGFIGDGEDSFINRYPEIDLRILVASATFYIPIYRDCSLGLGGIDACPISTKYALSKGSSVLVYPGGGKEALYTDYREDVILIKNRKGFVKLAIESGVSLVPVLCFNENDAYEQAHFDNVASRNFQLGMLSRLGITIPYLKNIIPKKCNVHLVAGGPINVPHETPASAELIEQIHGEYIKRVRDLYARYGAVYNSYKGRTLRII